MREGGRIREHVHRGDGHLLEGLVHGGEVDLGQGGEGDVVEAHEGDVLGDADARFEGGLHDADGQHVRGAEDGSFLMGPGEILTAHGVAHLPGAAGVAAAQHVRLDTQLLAG